MGASERVSLRLNGRHVDLQRGVIEKNSGPAITLRPQSAAVLKVLASRQGTLVSKDELAAAVWGGVAVTDDSLVQCITEIRKALGDDQHTVVKTVLKRGYMLAPEPGAQAFRRRRSTIVTAALLALIMASAVILLPFAGSARKPPAIAVLPFKNLSEDKDWSGFAAGLTEDIIADLARYRQIPVVAATSALPAPASAKTIGDIAKALAVKYVLEGTFRVDGYRMRVTARLIAADTGVNLWSDQYDRPAEKLLDVQDEITRRIAVTLTGWQGAINEAERALARRKSDSELDAYDYWLLGIEAKHRLTPEGLVDARRYFNKGLELAPDFMPLVRDLAITYCVEMDLGAPFDYPAAVKAHKEFTEKAFALDPSDDNTNAQMGLVENLQGNVEQAEFYLQRALELGRGNSDVALEIAWIRAGGQPDRAIALIDKALKANPGHPSWWNLPMAEAYFSARRFDDVLSAASRLGPSPNQSALVAMSAAQTGKADIAAKAASDTLRFNPGWTAESMFPYQFFPDDQLLIDSAKKAGLPVCMNAVQARAFSGEYRFAWCEDERAGSSPAAR